MAQVKVFTLRSTIEAHDLEVTIFETPRANWGIRGVPGDELAIAYDVGVLRRLVSRGCAPRNRRWAREGYA